MKCPECNLDFPEHLISGLVVGKYGDFTIRKMCPICALKIMNEQSGLPPGTPFRGPNAKKIWEEAKKYLTKVEGK